MNIFDLTLLTSEQIFLHIPLLLGAYLLLVLFKMPLLALEAAYVFGALFSAKMLFYSHSLFITTVAGFVGGMLVGITLYCLYLITQTSLLFSNIITIGIFHGLNQAILGKGVHISVHQYSWLLTFLPGIHSYPNITTLLLVAGIVLLLFYCFSRTALYLCFKVYGSNNTIFSHYKISQRYVECTGIILGCGLAGISGILVALHSGFADTSMGTGIILLCLMTLILGKLVIANNYNFFIICVGLLLYFIIQQILLNTAFDTRYFMAIRAVFIVLLLLIINNVGRRDSYDFGL